MAGSFRGANKTGVGRKHIWSQNGGPLTNYQYAKVTGFTSNSSGSIATMSVGNLKLNQAGLWHLSASFYIDDASKGQVQLRLIGPTGSGFFSGRDKLVAEATRQATAPVQVSGSGRSDQLVTWTGWVSEAMAAMTLFMEVYQANEDGRTVSTTTYIITAELLSS